MNGIKAQDISINPLISALGCQLLIILPIRDQMEAMTNSDRPDKRDVTCLAEKSIEFFSIDFSQRALPEKQKEALNECERLIQHFSEEASEHKHHFKQLKQLSISLTLTVTLLSALAASKKLGEWDWIVPTISGLAALSTTLLSQTHSQKTWVHSRSVQQRLQVEKFLYLQDAGNYSQLNSEDKTRHFSARIMGIWSEGHETWGQTVSQQKK